MRKHSHPLCRYLSRRSCFRSAASNCSPHLPLAGESASAALPAGSAAATAFPYNYLFRLLTLFLSPYSYSIDVPSAAIAVVVLTVAAVVVVVGVSSIVVVILKVLLCRTRISPVRFGFLTDFRRKYDVVSPLIMCFTERERKNQTKVGNTHIGIPFSQDCDIDIKNR